MSLPPPPSPREAPFAEIPDPLAGGAPKHGLALPPLGVERFPSPTRSELRRRFSLALGFCSAWLLGHVLAFGLRGNWQDLPPETLAVLVATPLFGAGLCAALARAGGRLGLGLRPTWLGACGAMALALPLGLGFALSPPAAPAASASSHLVCVLMVLGWSVPPLLVLSSVVGRSFAAQAGLRSAHLAAAAGLLGAALANLHCAQVEGTHVALAHGLPVTVLAVLGALFVAPKARS